MLKMEGLKLIIIVKVPFVTFVCLVLAQCSKSLSFPEVLLL